MRNTLASLITAFALVIGLVSLTAAPVGAINVFKDSCTNKNAKTAVCKAKNNDNVDTLIQDVISTLLLVIGVISVIMIIVGGIRYVLSNGEAGQITSAKNTILYAVIGLVVALLAYAIVNFVVARFG